MKAIGTINNLSVDAANKKAMGGCSRSSLPPRILKPEKGVVWVLIFLPGKGTLIRLEKLVIRFGVII